MTTTTRTDVQLRRPEELLREIQTKWLKCRRGVYGHKWDEAAPHHMFDVHKRNARKRIVELSRTARCTRCGMRRTTIFDAQTMEILGYHRQVPKGYYVHGSTERIKAHHVNMELYLRQADQIAA